MEENGDQPADRLWADDEKARDLIRDIDLSAYDGLVTYPAGIDWPLERKKILFLQAAIKSGFPWSEIVRLTAPHFGQVLYSGFEPDIFPIIPPLFGLPPFDISRQTVEQWTAAADEAWKIHRARVIDALINTRQKEIESGALKEFERPRLATGINGQKKAPILDERAIFTWAAVYFFAAQFGKPLSWAELAREELQQIKKQAWRSNPNPTHRVKLIKKTAEQIRTNVTKALRALNLPICLPE